MNRLLSFHPVAEYELCEAADYYDLERPGPGRIFLDQVESATSQILQFPEAALVNRVGRREFQSGRSDFQERGRD